MNKYFQIMWIAVAILAAWLIKRWPRPLIAAVLIVSAFSPALIGVWHVRSNRRRGRAGAGDGRALDRRQHARALGLRHRRVHQLPGRSRRAPADHDVRAVRLEPRLRPGAARGDTTAIYCDGPEVAAERMAVYGATYVLSSGGVPCNGARPGRTSRRARCSRPSTTRTGSRSGGWHGGVLIVTFGTTARGGVGATMLPELPAPPSASAWMPGT